MDQAFLAFYHPTLVHQVKHQDLVANQNLNLPVVDHSLHFLVVAQ
jgi:hypothetical protein